MTSSASSYLIHLHHTSYIRLFDLLRSEVLDHELDGVPERALLARLDLGVAHVPAHSEPVRAPGKVLARVARRVLPVAEQLVSDLLLLGREHVVGLARVDQDRVVRLRLEFLRTGVIRSGSEGEGRGEPTSKSSGTFRSDGCAITIAFVMFSSARSTA
jgi:hypothetical protein